MRNFTFALPTQVIFGKKILPRIGRAIRNHFGRATEVRVLLVSGRGAVRKLPVYAACTQALEKNAISFVEFHGVGSNPDVGVATAAAPLARDVDAVLAVGGGSVIDAAKCIAVEAKGKHGVMHLLESGEEALEALPIFVVSTCPGSGAEVSDSALLNVPDIPAKRGVKGPALAPRAAALDPRFAYTLPWPQTRRSGLDAFSHAFERYQMGAAPFSETSMGLCESVMRGCLAALEVLHARPEDYAARAELAWASLVGQSGLLDCGQGGGDWGLHVCSHAVSALHPHVRHGDAVAAMLPAWVKFLGARRPELCARWEGRIFDNTAPGDGIVQLQNKMRMWGAPQDLASIGFARSDVSALKSLILQEAARHGGLGRSLDLPEDALEELLDLAFSDSTWS